MSEIGALESDVSGEIHNLPKLKLSGRHHKMWMETRTALLWAQPYFADVFLSMMVDKNKDLAWFTDHFPVAATDDKFLYLNPATFFENYSLEERVFVICHEISHCIFNHCGMINAASQRGFVLYPDSIKLPYVNEIMQIAMDYLINDLLINGKVGKAPKKCWHDPNVITYKDDLFGAYRKLYKKQKNKSNSQSNSGQQGFDVHLPPGSGEGKSPAKAKEERNAQAWDNAVNAALKSARAQGRLPAALDRGFSKLLEPQVDWREHLQFAITKKIGNDRSTWNVMDNELMVRGIGAPGKQSFGCNLVVFIVDSSGSINQETMNMFMTECAGIVESIRPRKIMFMQCDTQIYDYTEIEESEDLMRKVQGGGGTDFKPPFKRIEEEQLEPDCLIYLTDLMGEFPREEPPYPVIWGTIYDSAIPWGEKVIIPQQNSRE